MAQEEVTESTNEIETTSTDTTQADNSIYLTCDFDLENIEALLPYLPDICGDIYYNRINDSTVYDLYLEESQAFAKFYKKLNDYELRHQPNGDKEEMVEYPFEKDLRKEAYNKADWSQCVTIANNSTTDYLDCLKGKRLELAELIPAVGKDSVK